MRRFGGADANDVRLNAKGVRAVFGKRKKTKKNTRDKGVMGTRKNAVNRTLFPVEGGVCAPEGFRAGSGTCGFKRNGDPDLALILPIRRCPAACVFSTSPKRGAPVLVSEKHIENGHAHAILVNGGLANVFQPRGERLAKDACRLVERYCSVVTEDVLVASTGYMGRQLNLDSFEVGIREAAQNLSSEPAAALSVAKAMAAEGVEPMQFAYEFELGSFLCHIGAAFKGNTQVSPNMATTLVFLTTDVNISPEMLKKALLYCVNETLNLTDLDGVSSPNDSAFILASGRADNWRIDCVDTDYKKFVFALKEVLRRVCIRMLCNVKDKPQHLYCRVYGARSTQVSRTLAKRLVRALGVKEQAKKGIVNVENILSILAESGGVTDFDKVRISVTSEFGDAVVYEDGDRILAPCERLRHVFAAPQVQISVGLSQGNYTSTGYTCI